MDKKTSDEIMDKEHSKVKDIVDKSVVSLGIEVGIAAGIYKAFEKHNRKCTCEELARTAGLKERYVKEWLGGMVAAELIYLNENSEYILPTSADFMESQSKASLTRIISGHFDHFLDVMKFDGHSGYDMYNIKGLAEFTSIEKKRPGSLWCIDSIFVKENIAPVVEWVRKGNDGTIKIMDFGCGNGIVTIQILKHIPNVNIVGMDDNEMIIERAKIFAKEENVTNCRFEVCRGEDMADTFKGSFDIVVMNDVLHDLADPDKVMKSVMKILKPGGYLIALDPPFHSDHRDNVGNLGIGGFYIVSMFVCLPNSLSRDAMAGNGMGWGYEHRKSYIEKFGFQICTLTDGEDVNEIKKRIVGKMI